MPTSPVDTRREYNKVHLVLESATLTPDYTDVEVWEEDPQPSARQSGPVGELFMQYILDT